MRETVAAVKTAFVHNPIASAFLALLLIGLVFLGAQSYLSRHVNWERDYDECLVTARLRWQTVKTNRADADGEATLAAISKGESQATHMRRSIEHDRLADKIEDVTAPTGPRRIAYCKRIDPEPGIFFG